MRAALDLLNVIDTDLKAARIATISGRPLTTEPMVTQLRDRLSWLHEQFPAYPPTVADAFGVFGAAIIAFEDEPSLPKLGALGNAVARLRSAIAEPVWTG